MDVEFFSRFADCRLGSARFSLSKGVFGLSCTVLSSAPAKGDARSESVGSGRAPPRGSLSA